MKSKIKDCAKIILHWHRNIGVEIASQMLKKESYHEYKKLVHKLYEAFLCDEVKPEKIAMIQLEDIFNNFSHEKIPFHLIEKFRLNSLIKNKNVVVLKDLADYILDHKEGDDDQPETPFVFPDGWIDEPIMLKPTSITVQVKKNSDIDPVYQAYSKSFKDLKKFNLGGIDLMVAAHNSVKKYQHKHRRNFDENFHKESMRMEQNSAVIYNPASFNYQFATGAKTLVTSVLKRKIKIKKVVVGTDKDWALKDKSKENMEKY